jgi:CheY-like chemotaxis protein
MTKIMLVEDDNNLREIYEARLLAEGYEIISAKDGEEALALAVKEKPDLIISDVMMPKISGFDMLDILRSTPETKNTKVIMMTALSQTEDKARADKLGADRYLVKSQVTLEDVAKVAHEVLSGEAPAVAGTPPVTDTTATTSAAPTTPAAPAADQTSPFVTPPPTADATTPAAPAVPAPGPTPATNLAATDTSSTSTTTAPAQPAAEKPAEASATATEAVIQPSSDTPGAKANELAEAVNTIDEESESATTSTTPAESSSGKKVITPITPPSDTPSLDKLLAEEEKKEAVADAMNPKPAPAIAVADAKEPPAEAPAAPAPEASKPDDTAATPPTPGNVVNPNDPGAVAL